VFNKFVWGFVKGWKQIPEVTFFLLHFNKNIKEIQSDCLLFIYHGLHKTKYIIQLFLFIRQTISNTFKVKVGVLQICLEICKSWKQIPEVTFFFFFI